MNDHNAILMRFPKSRPPLSAKEAPIHDSLMHKNRERLTLLTRVSDRLESWMHRQALDAKESADRSSILEIGAGTLNHVPYEPNDAIYDAIEPMSEMYNDKAGRNRVRAFYSHISEVEDNARYGRIVSIATLEHLTDLPFNVAKAGLLLEPRGQFRAGIPSEGGLLWWLSWRLVAVDLWLRTGYNWAEHMRHEHVNSAAEIITVVEFFFETVLLRRFPLPFHHLSFYVALQASQPRLDRCHDYLQRATNAERTS